MNWLLALLAFAGVMAILSTMVSVAVEAVHKFLALRRAGLQEMLRALHDNVLRDIAKLGPSQEGGASKDAVQFAKDMTCSPAFGGGKRWWWVRNIPFSNVLFQPHFERLSTLQFVEQLGRTPIGRSVAQWDRDRLRRVVHTMAFQFERFGQAQSDYFGRRAKVISTALAFSLVAALNIDAIALYGHLATSPEATGAVLARFEAEGEEVEATVENLRRQAEAIGEEAVDPAAARELRDQARALVAQYDSARSQVDELARLGLPIGPEMFPFCAPAASDAVAAAGAQAGKRQAMCKATSIEYDFVIFKAKVPANFWTRLTTLEGWVWVFSIIVTTGLVGLGAPFWFNLFRTLARLVGRERIAKAADKAESTIQAQRAAKKDQVRDPNAVDIDTLTESLLIASGQITAGAAPLGRRAGQSSADVVSTHTSALAPGGLPGMRQVRD